jgi:uncharacterized membrane protein
MPSDNPIADVKNNINLQSLNSELDEVTKDLPKETRTAILEMIERHESHSGPLPTPDYLEKYEQILPGLAERIVRIPEREQEFRHSIANGYMEREFQLKSRGQIFALIAMLLLLIFAGLLAIIGDTKSAATVAGVTIVGIVGIFVTGKYLESSHEKNQNE